MATPLVLLALAAACAGAEAWRPRRMLPRVRADQGATALGDWSWNTMYVDTPVDHFNFPSGNSSAATFSQRVLYNLTTWAEGDAPLFVYAGNEGDITLFAANTGWLWTLASEMGAGVVFIEHRFFGESMPFGTASYTLENLAYLSFEQALADYSFVVRYLRAQWSAPNAAAIVWGGSYGGMLAAWARWKYPSVFQGAIAASAPILQVPGLMDPTSYHAIVTRTFNATTPAASQTIWNGFQAILRLGATAQGRATIQQSMRLCGPVQNEDDLADVLEYWGSALEFVAMADYPYPADFLGPMPTYPAAVIAAQLSQPSLPDAQLLSAMASAIGGVFYNFSGQAGSCFNTSQLDPPGLEGDGWEVLCCRELVQPIGQYGFAPSKIDMFWPAPFSLPEALESCAAQFGGLVTRPYQVLEQYGDGRMLGASNIFLTNGNLDPWLSGGVVTNTTSMLASDVTAYIIQGGAHHLDLRTPNPADSPSVVQARAMQKAAIQRWVAAYAAS